MKKVEAKKGFQVISQRGRDALRYLMNAHGLKQSDLREERGLKPPPQQSLHTHRRAERDPVAR